MLLISRFYCQVVKFEFVLIFCLEREIDIEHVVSSMLSLPYSKIDWE